MRIVGSVAYCRNRAALEGNSTLLEGEGLHRVLLQETDVEQVSCAIVWIERACSNNDRADLCEMFSRRSTQFDLAVLPEASREKAAAKLMPDLASARSMHARFLHGCNGNANVYRDLYFLLLLQIEYGLAMHAIEQRRPTDCNDDSSSMSMIIIDILMIWHCPLNALPMPFQHAHHMGQCYRAS